MNWGEKKLTIGIPAFNEEKRIASTIESVYKMAEQTLDKYEILVVDDGSTDQTYKAALEVQYLYKDKVTILRKEKNEGVGAAFHLILEKAKFPHVCLIPGDNAYTVDGIQQLFSQVGTSPLVISFRQSMNHTRTKLRYFLSKVATTYLRIISGKKIRDAHSLYIFPVELTRNLKVKNTSYGYHMEILSRLLRRTQSFSEVPVELTPNPDVSSGVMNFRVLFRCGITMLKLLGLRLVNRL